LDIIHRLNERMLIAIHDQYIQFRFIETHWEVVGYQFYNLSLNHYQKLNISDTLKLLDDYKK